MPRWDFSCSNCGKVEKDVVGRNCEESAPICCGSPMEILWSGSKHGVDTLFEPFTTRHILPHGVPVRVRSRRHLAQLENTYGVQRVDDPDIIREGGQFVRRSKTTGKVFDLGS